MSNVRGVIGQLKALQQRLATPLEFYVRHEAPYRELARMVAMQVLVNLKPLNADGTLWAKQAQEVAGRVVSQLVNEGNVGMIISLSGRDAATAVTTDTRNYQLGGLSIAQVERFVAAGREKSDLEAPGKNLDSRDDGKSDLQIAWRIMYAIRLQKDGADRLEGHIMDYLAAEQSGAAEQLLPQVLKAWLDVFPPRALKDWRAFVHEAVLAA